MIEGLKIEISSDELKQHLERRANFHREKAEWYVEQVDSLKEGGVGPSRMSNDPVRSLEGSAQQHVEKTAYFAFMAEHLIPDERYRLSAEHLGAIEMASRYFPGVGGY